MMRSLLGIGLMAEVMIVKVGDGSVTWVVKRDQGRKV